MKLHLVVNAILLLIAYVLTARLVDVIVDGLVSTQSSDVRDVSFAVDKNHLNVLIGKRDSPARLITIDWRTGTHLREVEVGKEASCVATHFDDSNELVLGSDLGVFEVAAGSGNVRSLIAPTLDQDNAQKIVKGRHGVLALTERGVFALRYDLAPALEWQPVEAENPDSAPIEGERVSSLNFEPMPAIRWTQLEDFFDLGRTTMLRVDGKWIELRRSGVHHVRGILPDDDGMSKFVTSVGRHGELTILERSGSYESFRLPFELERLSSMVVDEQGKACLLANDSGALYYWRQNDEQALVVSDRMLYESTKATAISDDGKTFAAVSRFGEIVVMNTNGANLPTTMRWSVPSAIALHIGHYHWLISLAVSLFIFGCVALLQWRAPRKGSPA